MDMVAVDVHVLVYYERLLTEAEFVQILAGEDFILLLSQLVIGVRIEGDMENRFLSPAHFRHEQVEVLHHSGNVNLTVCRENDFVCTKHPAFFTVHLLAVVCQRPVER